MWRVFPYTLRHLYIKPFRSVPAALPIEARLSNQEYRRSIHDMYCEMFLDGYEQLTSLRVSQDTGLALVLFSCFMYTFDQEFERCWQPADPPHYLNIIDIPVVAEIWGALGEYLTAVGRLEVLTHLLDTFSAHYDDYCRCMGLAMTGGGFEATLRLARYDSGRTLIAMYDIIRLFNGHGAHRQCADEFFAIGMAGKFFDDLRDVADDVSGGSPNLMYAFTAEHPVEGQVLAEALSRQHQFTLEWWSANCPSSLTSYFRHAFQYYDEVRSSRLRLTLDASLMLLGSQRYWRNPIRRSPARVQ
jgi:hypothetical protein